MPKKAKVVEIHSTDILSDGKIDHNESINMIAAGLDALSIDGNGNSLVKKLIPINDTIGIKVNTLSGKRMSTSPVLVFALAEVLHKHGYKKDKIIAWDRREDELKRAGYKIKTGGSDFRCFATDTPGVGFSRKLYQHKSIGSLVSKIQTEISDSIIDFPVLKDHSLAGLSGCLKNYYGVIHNPNKYHENMCDPFQADLYSMNIVKNKQKLALFDAMWVQYNGGPGYMPHWVTEYRSILLSTDPVALDTVGAKIIDNLRTLNGLKMLKDIGREPVGIFTAGKDGLGCADLEDIEWEKIEI